MSAINKTGSVVAFIFNKIFMLTFAAAALLLIFAVPVADTVTDEDTVKQTLNDAEVYQNVLNNLLDVMTASEEEPSQQTFGPDSDIKDINKQTLRQAIDEVGVIDADGLLATFKSSLDGDYIQSKFEPVIDAIYSYARGDSEELVFSFTLRDKAEQLGENLKNFLRTSAQSLPQCTIEDGLRIQQAEANGEQISFLEQDCIPPTSNLEAEVDSFITELTADDGVLGKVYTEEDFDVSQLDLRAIRIAYSTLSTATVAIWLVIVGVGAAVIMTARTTYRGFKEVGLITFVTGVIGMILIAITPSPETVLNVTILAEDQSSEAEKQALINILEPLADSLITTVQSPMLRMSIILTVLGIALFVLGIVLKRHHYDHVHLPKGLRHDEDDSMSNRLYDEDDSYDEQPIAEKDTQSIATTKKSPNQSSATTTTTKKTTTTKTTSKKPPQKKIKVD